MAHLTDINVTGSYPSFTIDNTAPDQTVVLNQGANMTITGTYPTFTLASTASGGGQVDSVVAGTGISVNSVDPVNPVITNTAPDQTVTLTDGGNMTITGTYPNFTLAAAAGSSYPTNSAFKNYWVWKGGGDSFNVGGSGDMIINETVTQPTYYGNTASEWSASATKWTVTYTGSSSTCRYLFLITSRSTANYITKWQLVGGIQYTTAAQDTGKVKTYSYIGAVNGKTFSFLVGEFHDTTTYADRVWIAVKLSE